MTLTVLGNILDRNVSFGNLARIINSLFEVVVIIDSTATNFPALDILAVTNNVLHPPKVETFSANEIIECRGFECGCSHS